MAVPEHADTVGPRICQIDVVCRYDDRHSLQMESFGQLHDLHGRLRIETCGGLVHYHDLGSDSKGTGYGDPLPLTP